MKIGGQPKRRRKRSGFFAFIMITACLAGLSVWADSLMRPAIGDIIAYQAKVTAARLINEAILEEMERGDTRYDELVRVTRGQKGEIVSIEADMLQINRLKSRTGAAVIEKLQKTGSREIKIPLGTLIGNPFTSGRGPLVTVKIIPTGYVQSEIFNSFSSAGINQTLHQIMLRLNVQMAAVFPGYSVKTETETNFCIAETIIIGEIPQGYASLGGERPTYAPIG